MKATLFILGIAALSAIQPVGAALTFLIIAGLCTVIHENEKEIDSLRKQLRNK